MFDATISELETVARITMEPPNRIGPAERRRAESVLLEFRKSKTPYALCQQILERSTVDLLVFEAADLIKRAILTEWLETNESDRLLLTQYLINYVLQRNVQHFVREKILQVIGVIIKRTSVDDFGVQREQVLGNLEQILATGNMTQQFIACRCLLAIIDEFNITSRPENAGISFDRHLKVVNLFEKGDRKKIFVMTVKTLNELMKIFHPAIDDHIRLLSELLGIAECLLSWLFFPHCLPRQIFRLELMHRNDVNPSLRLNASWSTVICDSNILELFYGIYWKVRDIRDLQPKALQCIVQLATVHGAVFPSSKHTLEYFNQCLKICLQLLSQIDIQTGEAIGFTTIFRKLFLHNLRYVFAINPQQDSDVMFSTCSQTINAAMNRLYLIIIHLIEAAVYEEIRTPDESHYMTALNIGLETWLELIQNDEDLNLDMLKEYSTEIFKKYLQCHLSPPDGIRESAAVNSDELDVNEQNDVQRFSEQLTIIGEIGRQNVAFTLPILCQIIENKTEQLKFSIINAGQSRDSIYEDIHWTILLAGHLIAMDSVNEEPLIAQQIMGYSKTQLETGVTDLQISLNLFANPNKNLSDIPDAINRADHVIRIVTAVFRLCECDSEMAIDVSSPEVTRNLIWFMKIWSKSYLMIQPSLYSDTSETILQAFGDTPAGRWAVEFLIKKISINVRKCFNDQDVVSDSIGLFVSMVEQRNIGLIVLQSEYFNNIFELSQLDFGKGALLRGLTSIANRIENTDKVNKSDYLEKLLRPVVVRFEQLGWKEAMDSRHETGKSIVAIHLIQILEEIRCCNKGVRPTTTLKVYEIFDGVYRHLADILDLFHNFQAVVEQILRLLCTVVCNVQYRSNGSINNVCISVFRTYSKYNQNQITVEKGADDDRVECLRLQLKLLTQLLSTNFFEQSVFDDEPESTNGQPDVYQVCVTGLQYIMPMISIELLQWPTLCHTYYKTVTFFFEIKSHKICILPTDILSMVLQSIEMGLCSFGVEIQSICFEFLRIMAGTVSADQNPDSFMYKALQPFVETIIQMILKQDVSTNNKTECGHLLFNLICCYRQHFFQLIEHIIQTVRQQNPANGERLSKEFLNLTNRIPFVACALNKNNFTTRFSDFFTNIEFMFY